MAAMKHVGKVGEKPCVVVFREIPGEPENCLVVETGGLSPQNHDSLMNVIQSAEAQESNNISDVLNRRTFPDGSNMLTSLHYDKKLAKVSVSLVKLTPTPSTAIPLGDVNAEIRKLENKSNPPSKIEADPSTLETKVTTKQVEGTPANEEATAVTEEVSSDSVAKNLLVQATMLEEDAEVLLRDAEAKKEEAYRIDPELRPKKGPGRPRKLDIS